MTQAARSHRRPSSALTSALFSDREIRHTFAEVEDAGAPLHYWSADVRNEAALTEVVETVYREFGRIDGVIHGAGVIEDKLLVDKEPVTRSIGSSRRRS